MIIYYFSGTGNSLKVARDITEGNSNAKLIRIQNNTAAGEKSDIIGIVFPVYYYGLPLIVREFTEKLDLNKNTYVFAVATCGGSTGAAIKQIEDILSRKGLSLSAGFSIQMPDNYQVLYGPPPAEKRQRQFMEQKEAVIKIKDVITKRQKIEFHEKGKYLTKMFAGFMSSSFKPDNKDKNFWADNNCNGCGICSKICPADDIIMKDGRPEWMHHCQHCLACMQWCPQKSIQYNKGTVNRERYHHPDIKIQEMIKDI